MAHPRKKQKVSKVGVAVSILLHAGIITLLAVLAAREGLLGRRLKIIAVTMVPKEAPREKPKEISRPKPLEQPPELTPAAEPVKVEPPELKDPPPVRPLEPIAPPSLAPAPSVAPPPAAIPGLFFNGGATVESTSDARALYQGYLEYTLRSHWQRPDNLEDFAYVAEVEVGIDRAGQITSHEWRKASGNPTWDDSVRQALGQTKSLERLPPKGFPEKVLVRFDVQVEADALLP